MCRRFLLGKIQVCLHLQTYQTYRINNMQFLFHRTVGQCKLIKLFIHQDCRQTRHIFTDRNRSQMTTSGNSQHFRLFGQQFYLIRELFVPRSIKPKQFRLGLFPLTSFFLSLFIIPIMDKTPKSTAKFRCHPFHNKNHVYIFRGSRFHICMTQHNTACRTSYNHIVILEISKILPKFIQTPYCHISRIIFSNSFSTRGSLSSRKDKYNDNLSTYPCCPIFISGEYFQISILYLKSDDSHSAKE